VNLVSDSTRSPPATPAGRLLHSERYTAARMHLKSHSVDVSLAKRRWSLRSDSRKHVTDVEAVLTVSKPTARKAEFSISIRLPSALADGRRKGIPTDFTFKITEAVRRSTRPEVPVSSKLRLHRSVSTGQLGASQDVCETRQCQAKSLSRGRTVPLRSSNEVISKGAQTRGSPGFVSNPRRFESNIGFRSAKPKRNLQEAESSIRDRRLAQNRPTLTSCSVFLESSPVWARERTCVASPTEPHGTFLSAPR